MAPPPLPWSGGCQCGAVRYRVTAMPLTVYCCHCTECQRQSASAFGMSMRLPRAGLSIDWSAMKRRSRTARSGAVLDGHFCPDCGVRLVHAREGRDAVNVKAGTLDDTAWIEPVGHIWTASAQPWIRFDPDMITFDGQPPDDDALVAAFSARCGAGDRP